MAFYCDKMAITELGEWGRGTKRNPSVCLPGKLVNCQQGGIGTATLYIGYSPRGTLKVGCSELLNILQNRLMAVGIPLIFNVHSVSAKKLHFPHCSKYIVWEIKMRS